MVFAMQLPKSNRRDMVMERGPHTSVVSKAREWYQWRIQGGGGGGGGVGGVATPPFGPVMNNINIH